MEFTMKTKTIAQITKHAHAAKMQSIISNRNDCKLHGRQVDINERFNYSHFLQ
jgi:hypothetical protein